MLCHIEHTIDADENTFWDVYFDPEFNRALYLGHLQFTAYRVVEESRSADGALRRRIECTPKSELPAVVRKVFGDSMEVVELGRFDRAERRYHAEITPKLGGDRLRVSSEIWVEPTGDGRVIRRARAAGKVRLFGLGGMVEGLMEQQTRESHERSAAFMNAWLRERRT